MAIDSDSDLLVVGSRFSDGGRVKILMLVSWVALLNIPRLYRSKGLHNKSNSFIWNLGTSCYRIQNFAVDPEDKTFRKCANVNQLSSPKLKCIDWKSGLQTTPVYSDGLVVGGLGCPCPLNLGFWGLGLDH